MGVAPVQMTRQTHCRQRWQRGLRSAGVLFGLLGEPPLLLLREAQRVLLRNRDPLRLPDPQNSKNSSRVDSDPLENSYVPLLRPVAVRRQHLRLGLQLDHGQLLLSFHGVSRDLGQLLLTNITN